MYYLIPYSTLYIYFQMSQFSVQFALNLFLYQNVQLKQYKNVSLTARKNCTLVFVSTDVQYITTQMFG